MLAHPSAQTLFQVITFHDLRPPIRTRRWLMLSLIDFYCAHAGAPSTDVSLHVGLIPADLGRQCRDADV